MNAEQGLEPQTKALLDRMAASSGSALSDLDNATPQEARAAFEELVPTLDMAPLEIGRIEDRTIPNAVGGEMRVRLYYPRNASAKLPVLVYFHGGGFVLGSIESYDRVCRYLCRQAGILVISVDYRLAPEHKFPAAVEDAFAAVQWVSAQADEIGADRTRLAVGGDSAGGNLAAVVCQLANSRVDRRLPFKCCGIQLPGRERKAHPARNLPEATTWKPR